MASRIEIGSRVFVEGREGLGTVRLASSPPGAWYVEWDSGGGTNERWQVLRRVAEDGLAEQKADELLQTLSDTADGFLGDLDLDYGGDFADRVRSIAKHNEREILGEEDGDVAGD